VTSVSVFEAAIWLKSVYVIKSQKKNKYGNKSFKNRSPFKRWFKNGIHSLLRRADAERVLTSFTICDAYHYFAGQA